MSLIVALYAIKLAAKQTSSPKYSYGWQRAEILGALINGVFLLALCLSIFLEAVQRFFEPQGISLKWWYLTVVISQPVLILVVGSAGLASNIVGLALFHDHGHGGHSHGSGESNGHSHSHTSDIESGENSHANTRPTSSSSQEVILGEDGGIGEILPESVVRRASLHNARPRTNTVDRSPSKLKAKRTSRQSFASADDIYVSPAANRQFILNQAHEIQSGYAEESDSGEDGYNGDTTIPTSAASHNHRRSASIPHDHHNHAKPKQPGEGGGHSHQNLNMRGVFLHVLGDALGNIGVIATALFIWLTDFSWRFYSDPVISLVITAIIFSSALPLVKSASLILLQGVPRGISLDDVKEDILQVFYSITRIDFRSKELTMSMNYIFGNYQMLK
jgi:zinc transporter 1